jgi:tRNA 2-thiocytidine biosynthesis protein TtcA
LSTLPPKVNRLIGQALHAYRMLADGDRVLLAVSGGVDSLVLTWLLAHWRRKAPIDYRLLAVHLDMGFGEREAQLVEEQLRRLEVDYLIERTDFGRRAVAAEAGKSGCFHCARQRRNRLFALAGEKGFNKIAFGHHREDLIETFFLNVLYSGNISTMVPRQDLFGGEISLIRPLAFVDKQEIRELAEALSISPVPNPCPLAGDSKRESVRALLASLYATDPQMKANIFRALGNVKPDYLLRPQGKE